MASAPGQSSGQKEPVCYNCGLKGHWVVACPEPTREVPAGLKRWQSRHHDHVQRPDRNHGGSDKKPPIVTRYGPPPPAYSAPAAHFGQPPPPPPPPPYPPAGLPNLPPGQPSYPPSQYPPPPQQAPFFGTGYPPPPPPGKPQYGAYPPPPPQAPPPPPPPSPFSQQHSPPPHPSYGPPPPGNHYPPHQPPPPPGFPPPPGYYTGPQPAYPPQPYQPPPYPLQPSYQAPHYLPTGLPPPPPSYHPAPYPPPHYPPTSTQGYQPPPLPPPPIPPPPTTSYHQDNAWNHGPHSTSHQPRHQRGKKSRDRRLVGKGKGHQGNDRDRSSPVLKSIVPDGEDVSPTEAPPAAQTQEEPEPGEVAEDGEDLEPFDDWSVETEHHFEIVFADSSGKPADPVGIPLPYTYTDEPTIPPAYNATCIKSEFFHEDRVDEFIVPAQKRPEWHLLLKDPAFKRYPGMVGRTFEGFDGLTYPTFQAPVRHPNGAPVRLPPKFQVHRRAVDMASQRQRIVEAECIPPQRTRNHDAHSQSYSETSNGPDQYVFRPREDLDSRDSHRTPISHPAKRGLDASHHTHTEGGDLKRHKRAFTHQGTPSSSGRGPSKHHLPSTRPLYDLKASSPDANSRHDRPEKRHHSKDRQDLSARFTSRHDGSDDRRQRETSVTARHDSGYRSGQSPDSSKRYDLEDGGRKRQRSWSRGRSYSRGRQSRSRSREDRASRASSVTASNDRSRSSSPLNEMEYELLGLSRPREKAKATSTIGKKPVRKQIKKQVKVSAAYGRRW